MKKIQIDYFKNIKAKEIEGAISLEGFANAIRTPPDDVRANVEKVRRSAKGSSDYEKHKAALPCFLLNCRTSGGAKLEDVREVHPLLFCDIDGVPDGQFSEVKDRVLELLPSTLMVWRSVGGQGMGVLLHVEGVNRDNLLDLKGHLCVLQFNGYQFDKACFNLNRKTVHSFDPEIYVNWSAPALDWTPVIRRDYNAKCAVQWKTNTIEDYGVGIPLNSKFSDKLRFDNVADYFDDSKLEFRVFPEGVAIISLDYSRNGVRTNRNKWLFKNLVRIKWLNEGIPFSSLHALAKQLNRRAMAKPMEDAEVKQVALNVFRNSYQPIPVRKRKVLFNPAVQMSAKQKRALTAKIMGAARMSHTKQRIREAIMTYSGDERITAKLISRLTGLEVNNVRRKWPDFKELVKELNAARKANSEQGAIKRIGAGVLRNSTSFRPSSNSGPLRAAA